MAGQGLSPQTSAKANLSPRLVGTSALNPNRSGGDLTSQVHGAVAKPLYTRGSSKIGSGVIRPFQPSGAATTNHNISNTLVKKQE